MADKTSAAEITPHEAIERYERATREEPANAELYMDLGAAHYIAHHWDEAIAAFEKAVQLKPDLGHAHYYLGVLYSAKGDKERALQELSLVLRTSSNPILIAQAKARIPAVASPEQLASES